MRSRRHRTPDWREFEKLIARIEADAGPAGVVVKSPDRLKCKITGRLREVDGSIRTRVGAAQFLITLECRRRGKRQDVTWIEQLATKRQSLGADRTIAVSASGFSLDAEAVARRHGISLRKAAEVSVDDTNPVLKKLDFVIFWHKRCALAGVGIRTFRSTDASPPPDEFDFVLADDADVFAPIFSNSEKGTSWSINDIWHQVQAALDPYADIAKGTPPIIRTARVPYSGDAEIKMPSGSCVLGHVFLGMAMWIEPEFVSIEDAKRIEYGSSDKNALQRVEFSSKRPGSEDWRISLQLPKNADDVSELRTGGNWPEGRSQP